MEPLSPRVDAFRADVRGRGQALALEGLQATCGFAFVKRPLAGTGSAAAAVGFVTSHIDISDVQALGPLATKWLLFPLEKRSTNAFPDRLSLGRATNCDIVARFGFVSKLQGHVMMKDGAPTLYVDYGGPNPARHNGLPLTPKVSVPIASGDRLAIGPLALELLSPTALADLIAALAT